ncbi:MAG TPA: NAD(P)H-hydrate epimerase, partial [Candidatus Atribacteria bacterium]|nr:NAD(P)H-hydrate epimerase [Candidatus Atribacteria bacterium]
MLAVTPRQMREIDQRAINEYRIPGIVLMENAALGAVRYITDNYTLKPNDRITIAAGTGNNGGDGFAAARHLILLGYDVTTLVVGDGTPRGDAKANLEILENLRGEILCIKGEKDLSAAKTVIDSSALIVDALFGTGLDRP